MAVTSPLLIYLDTNVYSRPFDGQTQNRIQEEANAFFAIMGEAKAGKLRLLRSDTLNFEAEEVLDEEKRTKIIGYLESCKEHIHNSEELRQLSKTIQKQCHIRARDALHIASAILGNARYFLSCDDKVTQKKQANCYRRYAKNYQRDYFSVMNPKLFVENLHKGKLL
jgi:predicted nucleic acid-binding protein